MHTSACALAHFGPCVPARASLSHLFPPGIARRRGYTSGRKQRQAGCTPFFKLTSCLSKGNPGGWRAMAPPGPSVGGCSFARACTSDVVRCPLGVAAVAIYRYYSKQMRFPVGVITHPTRRPRVCVLRGNGGRGSNPRRYYIKWRFPRPGWPSIGLVTEALPACW